jgi:hypothetical protein
MRTDDGVGNAEWRCAHDIAKMAGSTTASTDQIRACADFCCRRTR